MILKEDIIKTIEQNIDDNDIFLVDVTVKPGNKISVIIDSNSGIKIIDCVKTNRLIEKHFDREVEDYELQVSSPGIDKPFTILKQYQKNIEKAVEVLTSNGATTEGLLKSVNEQGIQLEVEKSIKEKNKKQLVKEIIEISFQNIKTTKLVTPFKMKSKK